MAGSREEGTVTLNYIKTDSFQISVSWRHIKDFTIPNSVRTDYIRQIVHILCDKIQNKFTQKK